MGPTPDGIRLDLECREGRKHHLPDALSAQVIFAALPPLDVHAVFHLTERSPVCAAWGNGPGRRTSQTFTSRDVGLIQNFDTRCEDLGRPTEQDKTQARSAPNVQNDKKRQKQRPRSSRRPAETLSAQRRLQPYQIQVHTQSRPVRTTFLPRPEPSLPVTPARQRPCLAPQKYSPPAPPPLPLRFAPRHVRQSPAAQLFRFGLGLGFGLSGGLVTHEFESGAHPP